MERRESPSWTSVPLSLWLVGMKLYTGNRLKMQAFASAGYLNGSALLALLAPMPVAA